MVQARSISKGISRTKRDEIAGMLERQVTKADELKDIPNIRQLKVNLLGLFKTRATLHKRLIAATMIEAHCYSGESIPSAKELYATIDALVGQPLEYDGFWYTHLIISKDNGDL